METPVDHIEDVLQSATAYGKTTYELVKLKVVERISRNIGALTVQLLTFVTCTASALILSAGIALWIGDLLGKSYYGFFIVAGVYLILALMLGSILKNRVKSLVGRSMIKELLES